NKYTTPNQIYTLSLHERSSDLDIKDAKDCGKRNEEDTREVLCFENVNFRFSDAEENTLENISFSCRRGETTAIIGSTGSGKSTIDRKSTRLNSSHVSISYAVFC